jgi:hypothetical protein
MERQTYYRMRIVYNAQGNKNSDDTEGHIRRALKELGHEVVSGGNGDIYLFHKEFNPPPSFRGKKVCWYFDKIWKDRVNWFNDIYPRVDLMFITDWTWGKEYPKCRLLRQGIGDYEKGIYEDRGIDVAFVGNPYGQREELVEKLKKWYGERFKVYERQYNRSLNNLCASVPIFVAPEFPSDDDYWSNRVYLLTGSGGFVIHPRLKGLEREWGDNLVYYDNLDDLKEKVDYYLLHPKERKKMNIKEYNYCVKNFTYKKRVEDLIKCIKNELVK